MSREPASTSAGALAAPQRAARRFAGARAVVALAVLTLSLGAVAGVAFYEHASVHLRSPPRLPSCVRAARAWLRRPVLASGTEPRQTASGETVYLTPAQDRAVACAFLLSEPLARHLAGALAEHDPARRAAALLELVRDHTPADPAHDRAASAGYHMARAAISALPAEVSEVRAAAEELDRLDACRFATRQPCPTRPPVPLLVWITGVPAALGLMALTWMGGAAGAGRLSRWWRARRSLKKDRAPSEARAQKTKRRR